MPLKLKIGILTSAIAIMGIVLLLTRPHTPRDTIKAGFDSEFLTRPDGYQGLKKFYGFEFASDPVHLDPGLMYKAVADGAVDVICGFATDGRIPAYHLQVLVDDRGFFPPYYAAPLVREETLKKHPELRRVLNRLAGRISDRTMQQLNYQADGQGRKAEDVARQWLISQGLIEKDAGPADGSSGTITIGGKEFTEQEIIGQIMAILIEHDTDLKVNRRLMLGGTMICFNAIRAGDLDLYPEYTGTALVNILKMKVISDPELAYQTVKKSFNRKYDLVWLKPFGFNNTYTLTMRRDEAEKLHLHTISDLARFINTLNKNFPNYYSDH